jgi:hypothetical protein
VWPCGGHWPVGARCRRAAVRGRPARRPVPLRFWGVRGPQPRFALQSARSRTSEARSPQQQAEQVRDGLRDLGFQLKDLNADHPGKPPAWVFWHPQLFLEDQVTAIKARLDKALDHFQRLAPEQLEACFRKPSGAVGDHFIVEDKPACDLPGARMAIELIRQRLGETLFAQTPYKVVGLALVFRRLSPQPDADPNGPMHQDKYTGTSSKEVWECPSAAQGKSDCLCSCAPKQAAVGRKKKRKSTNTSLKQQC